MHELHMLSKDIKAKESQLHMLSQADEKRITAILHEIEALKMYQRAIIDEEKEKFRQKLEQENLKKIDEMRTPKKVGFISSMKARLQI